MRVLLAVDGSTFSDEAVREVSRRPWPTGSEVRVISVVEPPVPPSPEAWGMAVGDYLAGEEQWRESQAHRSLEAATLQLQANEDRTLKVTTEVLRGHARQAILDEAESWGADLIVLGSHGRGFWDRLLLGSVSNAVATHAKCSVEIVRRPVAEEA